jgi:hypothetical protein
MLFTTQVYELQALIVVVFEVEGVTVKFKVAKLSHPEAFVKVSVCVPAARKVKLFHVYGSSEEQMVVFVTLVDDGFTVKFNVAKLSHPEAFVKVSVCEPAARKVKPFHV